MQRLRPQDPEPLGALEQTLPALDQRDTRDEAVHVQSITDPYVGIALAAYLAVRHRANAPTPAPRRVTTRRHRPLRSRRGGRPLGRLAVRVTGPAS
jgi:hypothetical protein